MYRLYIKNGIYVWWYYFYLIDRKEVVLRFIRRFRNVLVGEGNIVKFDCRIIVVFVFIVIW